MDLKQKIETKYFYTDLKKEKIPTLVFSLKNIKEETKFNNLFDKALEIGYESFEIGNENFKFYLERLKKEQEKGKEKPKNIYIFLHFKYDKSLCLEIEKNYKNINFVLTHCSNEFFFTKDSLTFKNKKGFYNYFHSSYLLINNSTKVNQPRINERKFNPLNFDDNIKQELKKNECLTLSKSIFDSNNKLLFNNSFLNKLKEKYKKSIYQILIRWNLQKENLVIIKTDNEDYIKEDFDVFNFNLKEIEMKKIDSFKNNLLKFENYFNQIKYIKCLNENCYFPALIKFKNNKIISSCQLNHENEINSLKDYYFVLNNLNDNFTKCNICKKKFKINEERIYCKICDYYFHNFHNSHFEHKDLLNKETILTDCPIHFKELTDYSKEKETAFCELCIRENYQNINYEEIKSFDLNEDEKIIANFINESDLECCNEDKYIIKEYLYYKERNIINYHIIQSTKNVISLYPKQIGNNYFSETPKKEKKEEEKEEDKKKEEEEKEKEKEKKEAFNKIKNNYIIYLIINNEEIIVYDKKKNLKLLKYQEHQFNEVLTYGKKKEEKENYNIKNIFLQQTNSGKIKLSILTKNKMYLFDSYLNSEEKEEKDISENVIYGSYSIIVENFYNNEIIIKQRNKETNEYLIETFIRNKHNFNLIVLNDIIDDKNENNLNNINDGYLNFLYSYSKKKYLMNYTLQNYKSSNFLNSKNSKQKFTKMIPFSEQLIFFITNNLDIYYWKLNDKNTDNFQLFKTSEEVFQILSSCDNIFIANESLVLYSNEEQKYLSFSDLVE